MKKKMTKSEKKKIVKPKESPDALDDGIYTYVGARMGKGKKPRLILEFEEGGERFPVQVERRKNNIGEAIQKAHRRLRLKRQLRLQDLGIVEIELED
jgi:hypothetical protein